MEGIRFIKSEWHDGKPNQNKNNTYRSFPSAVPYLPSTRHITPLQNLPPKPKETWRINQSINHTYRFFLASSSSPKKLTTRETWNREDRSRKTTKPGNREKERKLGLQTKIYCFLNTQRMCARQKLADRYWSYATARCKNSWEKPKSGRHRGCEAPLLLRETKQNWVLVLGLAALHPSLAS